MASTHPCLHCCLAPTQHTPMSPLLIRTHPTHTYVSIADQHPSSTHPCQLLPAILLTAPTTRKKSESAYYMIRICYYNHPAT